MRPDGVVVPTPGFDDHLGFLSGSEPLHRQAFVTQLAVEGFVGAILPRFPGIAGGGVDAGRHDPVEDRPGHEFRSVIAAQIARGAVDGDLNRPGFRGGCLV